MKVINKYPDFLNVLGNIFSTNLTQDDYRASYKNCAINCSIFSPQMKYFGVFGTKNVKVEDINQLDLNIQLPQHAIDTLNSIPNQWERYINHSNNKQYILYCFRVIAAVIYQFWEIIESKNFDHKEFAYRVERMEIVIKLWRYVNEKYGTYLIKLMEPVFDSLSLNTAIICDDTIPKELIDLYIIFSKESNEILKNKSSMMGNKLNIMAYTFLLSIIDPLAVKLSKERNIESIIEYSTILNGLVLEGSLGLMKNSRHNLYIMAIKTNEHVLNLIEKNLTIEEKERELTELAKIVEKIARIISLILISFPDSIQYFDIDHINELLLWYLDNCSQILGVNMDYHSELSTKNILDFDMKEPGEFELIYTFMDFMLDRSLEVLNFDNIMEPLLSGIPSAIIDSFIDIHKISFDICQKFVKHSIEKVLDILVNPTNYARFQPLSTCLSARLAFCTLYIIHKMPKEFKVKLNSLLREFLLSKFFGEDLVYWTVEGEYGHLILDIHSLLEALLVESTDLNNLNEMVQTISTITKRSPLYAFQMIPLAFSLISIDDISGKCVSILSREMIPDIIQIEKKIRSIHAKGEDKYRTLVEDIRMIIIKFIQAVLSKSPEMYNTRGVTDMVFRHLFESSIRSLGYKNFEEGYSSSSFIFKDNACRYMARIMKACLDPIDEGVQNIVIKILEILRKYPSNDNFESLMNSQFFETFGECLKKSIIDGKIDEKTQQVIADGIRLTTSLLSGLVMNAKRLMDIGFYDKIEETFSNCEFDDDLAMALIMHIFGDETREVTIGRPIDNITAVPYILKALKGSIYFIRIIELLKNCCMHSFSNSAKLSSVGIPVRLLEVYCEGMEKEENLSEVQEKAGELFVEIIQRTIDQDTLRSLYKKMFEVEQIEEGKKPVFKRICNNRHPFYLLLKAGKAVKIPTIPSLFSFSKKDSYLQIRRINSSDLTEFTVVISFMHDLTKEDSTASRSLLCLEDSENNFISIDLMANSIFVRKNERFDVFDNSILINRGEFVTAVISFQNSEVECTIKCGDAIGKSSIPITLPEFNDSINGYIGKLVEGSPEELVLNVASISIFKGGTEPEKAAAMAMMTIGEQASEDPLPFFSVSPSYSVENSFCQNIGTDPNILVTLYGDRFSFSRSLHQMIRYVSGPCSFLILIPQILDETSCGSEDALESKKRFFLAVLEFFERVVFVSDDLKKAFFEEKGFSLMNQCIRKVKTEEVFGKEFVDSMSTIWDEIDPYYVEVDSIKHYIEMLKEIWISKRMIEIVNNEAKIYFIKKSKQKFGEFMTRFGDKIKDYENEIPKIWPILTLHQGIYNLDLIYQNEEMLQSKEIEWTVKFIESVTTLASSIGSKHLTKDDHDNLIQRIYQHMRDNQTLAVHTPGEILGTLGHIYEHNQESLNYIDETSMKTLGWTFLYIPEFSPDSKVQVDYAKELINLLIDIVHKFKLPNDVNRNRSINLLKTSMFSAAVSFSDVQLSRSVAELVTTMIIKIADRYQDDMVIVGCTLPLIVELFVWKRSFAEDFDFQAVSGWLKIVSSNNEGTGIIECEWWSFWIIQLINCYECFEEGIPAIGKLLKLESELRPENLHNSISVIIMMLSQEQTLGKIAIYLVENGLLSNAIINEGFGRIAVAALLLMSNVELDRIISSTCNSILQGSLKRRSAPLIGSDVKIEEGLIEVLKKVFELSTKKTAHLPKIVSFCLGSFLIRQPERCIEKIVPILLSMNKKDSIAGIRGAIESNSIAMEDCIRIDNCIKQFPELQAAMVKNIGSFEKLITIKSTLNDVKECINKELNANETQIRADIDTFRNSMDAVADYDNTLENNLNMYSMDILRKSEQELIEEYHIGRDLYTRFVTSEVAFGGPWSVGEDLKWKMVPRLDKYLRTTFLLQDTRYDNHGKYVKGTAKEIVGDAHRANLQLSNQTITGRPTVHLNIDQEFYIGRVNSEIGDMSNFHKANCILDEDGFNIIYQPPESVDGNKQELATIKCIKFDDISMVLKRQYPYNSNSGNNKESSSRPQSPFSFKGSGSGSSMSSCCLCPVCRYYEAAEIFIKNGDSVYLLLKYPEELKYEDIEKHITKHRKDILVQTKPIPEFFKAQKFTEKWRSGEMTNYEYLMRINIFGGRTLQVWQLYPVLPFLYINYSDPSKLRDFGRHHHLQKEENIVTANERVKSLKEVSFEFYLEQGIHTSFVMSDLGATTFHAFIEPFTSSHIQWQGGRIEEEGRYFRDIGTLDATKFQSEMTPQMFTVPELFKNVNGYKPYDSTKDEATMPSWANSAEEFIWKHMELLESPEVSRELPKWIDMVFGYKLLPKEADKAMNSYGYGVFTGTSSTGICLQPVFMEPHPQRKFDSARLTGLSITPGVQLPAGLVSLNVYNGGCVAQLDNKRCVLYSIDKGKLSVQREMALEGNGHVVVGDVKENVLFDWSSPTNSLHKHVFSLFKVKRSRGNQEEFSPVHAMAMVSGGLLMLHKDCCLELVGAESLMAVWKHAHNSAPAAAFGVNEETNVIATANANGNVVLCDLVHGEFITSFVSAVCPHAVHVAEEPWVAVVGDNNIEFLSLHGTRTGLVSSEREILASCVAETGSMRSYLVVAFEDEVCVVDSRKCSGNKEEHIEETVVMRTALKGRVKALGFDRKMKKVIAATESTIYVVNLEMSHNAL